MSDPVNLDENSRKTQGISEDGRKVVVNTDDSCTELASAGSNEDLSEQNPVETRQLYPAKKAHSVIESPGVLKVSESSNPKIRSKLVNWKNISEDRKIKIPKGAADDEKCTLDSKGYLHFNTKVSLKSVQHSPDMKRGTKSEAGYSALSSDYNEGPDRHLHGTKSHGKFKSKLEDLKKLYEWYGDEIDYFCTNKYYNKGRDKRNRTTEFENLGLIRPALGQRQNTGLAESFLTTSKQTSMENDESINFDPRSSKVQSPLPEIVYSHSPRQLDHDAPPQKHAEAPEILIGVEPVDNSKVTAVHAFFVAVKAFVGTGVLFLPKGFFNGGLVFSSILMIFVAYSTLYCMLLLADASAHFKGLSYGEVAGKLYGPKIKGIVLLSICLSQAGFCCAYYIFISQNIRDFVLIVSNCKITINSAVYIFGQLIFTIPLCLVRSLGNFSITSIIGDFIIVLSIAYIVGYCIWIMSTKGVPIDSLNLFNLQRFTHFVGAAMFSFEGIALVTPLSETMKEPKKLKKILSWCILFVLTLFLTVGVFGYVVFRKEVETNVILNLPDNIISRIIRVVYSVAILLSFPVLLHPCTSIIEDSIFKTRSGRLSLKIKHLKNLFRAVEVSALSLFSYLGSQHLENVVSLIGCFACIPIAFIYPAALHAKISDNKFTIIKDWFIVATGFVALLYTTYITIESFASGEVDIPKNICNSFGKA